MWVNQNATGGDEEVPGSASLSYVPRLLFGMMSHFTANDDLQHMESRFVDFMTQPERINTSPGKRDLCQIDFEIITKNPTLASLMT